MVATIWEIPWINLSLTNADSFLFHSAASTNMKNHSPYVQLQNGFQVPLVGFGTSQALDEVAEEAVSCALDTGYRLIDTAAFYDNEAAIGRALHQKCLTSNLRREDVFVTTKVRSCSDALDFFECKRAL
ncbi:hypothetical protein SprV_0100501800 [Sparganum proliferum]